MDKLLVNELFASIQGEGTRAGLPCVFVRLSGCNLRCRYCDTLYARENGGREMTVDEVICAVAGYKPRLVEVTGGEPLLQIACRALLKRLLQEGYEVLLETNGSMDLSGVDPAVVKIVDFKCPSSGESDSMLWTNIRHLTPRDEVKFVIGDRGDYEWARGLIQREHLADRCVLLFSPVFGEMEPRMLAEWILGDALPVRLQLQLHKIIWGEERGR
jgi:7-carboxy-7-deazaguanine synthase